MAFKYGGPAAFEALVAKIKSLVSSVQTIATTANTAAGEAKSTATAAKTAADNATTVASQAQSTATAAKTAADNAATAAAKPNLANATGILPISKGGTGKTTAAAALAALGGATYNLYTATVPGSGWSGNATSGFTKAVTISGIKSTDVPVVGIVQSSDAASAKLQLTAFGCINRITTATNSITCYAYSKAPTTNISIQLLVVRKAS